MHINDLYTSLIVRYLKKEISEAEQQELFHWVYKNNENETLFYSLKDIWETAHYESIVNNAETDAEWEKLALAAIQNKSYHFSKKRTAIRVLYRAVQIAAIVVITFGIGFFAHKYLPEQAQYTSINVPFGAKSELQLPDGSKIWVNSGSVVRYPTELDAKEVNLYLEGEAFFDIVKNPKRVLNVKTSTINIQVHGTSFNVKSYIDEDVVETTLLEGSISITGQVGNKVIKEPVYLKPNEQAILTKSVEHFEIEPKENREKEEAVWQKEIEVLPKEQVRLEVVKGIDTEEFVMWKDNILVFKNERFEDLAIKLERWYDVEITIENETLKNSRYTGTFEKENVEQALYALSISLPFKYKIDKNKITILKNN